MNHKLYVDKTLKLKICLIFLSVFFCCNHATAKTEGPNYTQLNYEQGVLYCAKGDYNSAIKYLDDALKLSPNNVSILVKLGSTHIQNSMSKDAIPLLNRASLLTPGDPNIHYLLGLAHSKNNDPNKAYEEFTKALQISPNNHLIGLDLGIACKLKNDMDCALENLEKAAKAYPDNLRIKAALATALHGSNNLEEAKQKYAEILESNSDNIQVVYNLANILISEKKYSEALKKINKAIELDPNFVDLYLDRARINYELGDLQSVQNDYSKAIKLDVVNPEIPKEFATFLIKTGAYAQAAKQLDVALELQPDDIDILVNKAYLLHVSMSIESAYAAWKDVLKVEPNNETAIFNLALLEQSNNKNQEALEFFKKLASIKEKNKQDDYDTNFGLAYNYQILGDSARAEALYERLKTKNPADAFVTFNLGVLHSTNKSYDKAIEYFHEALDQGFEDKKLVYEKLVSIYERLDDKVHQKLCYEKLLEIDANNIEARISFAQFLKAQGDSQGALNQLLLASSLDKTATTKLKMAVFLLDQKDFYGAIGQLQDYLSIYPDDKEALKLLAKTFQEANIHEQAINTYKRIVSLESGNYIAYYNLGLLYQKLSSGDKAKDNFLKAIELNSNFAPPYFAIGLSYLDDNQGDEAKKWFEKYLNLEPNGEYRDIAQTKIKDLNLKSDKIKSQV